MESMNLSVAGDAKGRRQRSESTIARPYIKLRCAFGENQFGLRVRLPVLLLSRQWGWGSTWFRHEQRTHPLATGNATYFM